MNGESLYRLINTQNPNLLLVDARPFSDYNKGHIPHAVNIDWIDNLENEKFKDTEKLFKLYSFIPKDKEVITYCQGGYRAANTYLVLKKLGYSNVKMYLGSWGEWGNVSSLPIQ